MDQKEFAASSTKSHTQTFSYHMKIKVNKRKIKNANFWLFFMVFLYFFIFIFIVIILIIKFLNNITLFLCVCVSCVLCVWMSVVDSVCVFYSLFVSLRMLFASMYGGLPITRYSKTKSEKN